jgi:hypothetical protein
MFQAKLAQKIKTHFMTNESFPKIVPWKNMAQPDTPHMHTRMTIRRIHFAFWIIKVRDKHSEYVIPVFPQQQFFANSPLFIPPPLMKP